MFYTTIYLHDFYKKFLLLLLLLFYFILVSLNVRKDYYGTDLLSLATQKEHNDIVKILMKMNLDPRLKNNYGVTPVHWYDLF